MHGQFVWYELTTPDVDAARRFYPTITGWGTQEFDKDYTMWTTGGAPFAGIFRLRPEQREMGIPPNWMPYIEADNVDETTKGVTSLGGKVVVGPSDIPGTGRFAVVQDPQGATFGIYKSINPSRAWDGTPVLGRFSWHELMTTDSDKAFRFYRQLFGWEQTGPLMDMGDGMMYRMYGKKAKMYGGMFNRTPEMAGMPPFWLVYVNVQDVQKAVDATTRAGGMVQRPPMDVPNGGRIAILGDPQGAAFAVHSSAQASKPAAQAVAKPSTKAAVKKGVKKGVKNAVKNAVKKAVKAVKKAVKAAKKAARRPKAKLAKSRPKAKAASSRKKSAAKKPTRRPNAKSKSKSKGKRRSR